MCATCVASRGAGRREIQEDDGLSIAVMTESITDFAEYIFSCTESISRVYDATRRDATRCDATRQDGTGRDGTGRDGTGRDVT